MITFETLVDIARKVAESVGVELHSVDVHPSGALRLFTSEGKKYFEPAAFEDASEFELAAAILDVFRSVVKVDVVDAETPAMGGLLPENSPTFAKAMLAWIPKEEPTEQETPKAKRGRKPKAEG